MKKGGIFLILLGIFLIFPLVLAQEQSQTYSGFNRFTDNVKLFFSSGENKVDLALEIREKEVDSALENLNKNNEATKNLERARNKLLLVQERVSINNADEVKNNVNEVINKINNYENLSDEVETYILEEEKTQLTAELVVEVDGKEGQTLKREVVKDGTTGQNTIKIVVMGENGEEIITETQGQIGQIQNQIAERVVKIDMAGQVNKENLENGVYVAKGDGSGDDGLKPEVKTDIKEGTTKNDPLPEPDLNKINPDLYDPDAEATTDIIEGGTGENIIEDGDCGDEVVCGGENDIIENVEGTEGTNDIAPAVDSNEGDSDVTITGEVIALEEKESFLSRFFKKIIGR